MQNNEYDIAWQIRRSSDAQKDYCERNNDPFFARGLEICPSCHSNIYTGKYGYTYEEASTMLITSCPHCGFSFCD